MSDFTQHGKSVVLLLLFIFISHLLFSQSETHRSDALVTDNNVSRVEHSNGYTMISGGFSSIGQYTGGGVFTDVATGKVIDASMPKINGSVSGIVSDGNGGWYIGGYFDVVDTVKVANLVHIKSDKTVDRAWKPNPDSQPNELKVSGTTLYVGGYFNEIAGQLRNYLVSFDITTGALNAWNPNPNSSVDDIEVTGTSVIVGGSFTQIGAVVRTRLAAFNVTTGALTSWAPSVNAQVVSLALDGTGVFVGGNFTSAGGSARVGLARIDLTSGLATAPVITLSAGAAITDLEVSTGILYVAGIFSAVNGITRYNLAGVTIATSTVTTLDAGLTSLDYVEDIALDGALIYFSGLFNTVAGISRSYAAAINTTTGALSNWNPSMQSSASCILPSSAGVWLGGGFNTVGNSYYNGFVLIEEATNKPWPFQVDIGGYVNTIAVKDNIVYIGGQFSSVNKSVRSNLAALDLRTGTVLAWDPRVYGLSITDRTAVVNSIRIKDNLLFVGGKFYAVNAMTTVRSGLAAVDLTTGAATSWNPMVGDGKTINQYVNAIDIVGTTLYAGGAFNLLNLSVTRNNIAAISTENANILSWDPNSSGEVYRVRANEGQAFVTGSFQAGIGGAMRPYGLALLDVVTAKATSWNPTLDGNAYDVALGGNNVFVAGYFSTVDRSFRPGLASFDLATQTLNAWTPDVGDDGDGGYSTNTLATSTSRLYVGGSFQELGAERRPYYAEYDLCPARPLVALDGNTFSTTATGDLQWYANGVAITGATGQTLEVSPIEYGVYTVSITQYGCEVVSDDAVYSVTALESDPYDAFTAFPNPVEADLTLQLPSEPHTLNITITDIMGRVLYNQSNAETRTVSFAGYRPGTYLLIVQADEARYVKKIMKIR